MISDTGTNFVSDEVRKFCRKLNIYHTLFSSYTCQSHEEAEACIKFVKRPMENAMILIKI